ncbi:MAG: fabF2, partial [Rhodospirillaceae bacterium]
MKRVVVTGMGMVTPLGCGVGTNWERLINGESGICAIDRFDVSDLPSRIAGVVPRGRGKGLFNPDAFVPPKEQRRMDDFILYALAAAIEAVEDSGWKPQNEEDRARTGVIIGSGIGGLPGIAATSVMLEKSG